MAFALVILPPVSLARSGLQTTKEVRAFILEEHYSFFVGLTKVVQKKNLLNLAFFTRRASSILALGGVSHSKVFVSSWIQKDK